MWHPSGCCYTKALVVAEVLRALGPRWPPTAAWVPSARPSDSAAGVGSLGASPGPATALLGALWPPVLRGAGKRPRAPGRHSPLGPAAPPSQAQARETPAEGKGEAAPSLGWARLFFFRGWQRWGSLLAQRGASGAAVSPWWVGERPCGQGEPEGSRSAPLPVGTSSTWKEGSV